MWLERNKKHSRMASLTTRVKGQQVGPLHYLPNTAEALKSAIDAMIAAGVVVPKDDFLETQIKDGMTIKQIIAELKKIAA